MRPLLLLLTFISFAVAAQPVVIGNAHTPAPMRVTETATRVYVTNVYDVVSEFDLSGNFIRKIGTRGDGPGQLAYPVGIDVDANGHIYVGDGENLQIVVYDQTGNHVGSFGGGFVKNQQPASLDLAIGSDGNVYVLDPGNNRVKVFTPEGVLLRTIGSGGTGDGQMLSPNAIALDNLDNVYITDSYFNGGAVGRVLKFSSMGTYLSKVQGAYFLTGVGVSSTGMIVTPDGNNSVIRTFDQLGGSTTFGLVGQGGRPGEFYGATGVHVTDDEIYIADNGNNRIQVFNMAGVFQREFGSGGGATGSLKFPMGTDLDAAGKIYIADAQNNRIQVFSSSGAFVSSVGSYGNGDGLFNYAFNPQFVNVDDAGNVFVMDQNRVQVFTSSLVYSRSISSPGSGTDQLANTLSMTFSGDNVLVAIFGGVIKEFNRTTGAFVKSFGQSGTPEQNIVYPYRLAADGAGNIYVCDNGTNVKVFNSAGQFVKQLNIPAIGLAFHNGKILAGVDNVVKVYETDGTWIGQYGAPGFEPGQFFAPRNVTVKGNTMVVTDLTRVQKFDLTTLTMAAAQSVNFTIASPKQYGDAPFDGGATATSGLPVVYESSNTAVATVSGSTITIVGVGTTTITASQAGNAAYAPAETTQQLVVNKKTQTLTFSLPDEIPYSFVPITLNGASNTDRPITYFATPAPVVGIENGKLVLRSIGQATVTAYQAGDENYADAVAVVENITIVKAPQTISFPELPQVTYGEVTSLNSGATLSTGNVVMLSSDNTDVATVNFLTINIVGAGTATITASHPGNSLYEPAVSVARTLVVAKASQSITFGALQDRTLGNPAFQLSATSSAGLPVTFTTTSTNISVNGISVQMTGAGRASVTASQAGDNRYNAATPVTQSFCIKPSQPTIELVTTSGTTLVSSSANNNQWYRNGAEIAGAAQQSLVVTESGQYTVKVTVDDCASELSAPRDVTITPPPITAITETPSASIRIFPNPVSEELAIDLTHEQDIAVSFTIYNMLGQAELTREGYTNRTSTVDVRELKPGLYLLIVASANKGPAVRKSLRFAKK